MRYERLSSTSCSALSMIVLKVLEARSAVFSQLLRDARTRHNHSAECFISTCKYLIQLDDLPGFPDVSAEAIDHFFQFLYDGTVTALLQNDEIAKRREDVKGEMWLLYDYFRITTCAPGASMESSSGTDYRDVRSPLLERRWRETPVLPREVSDSSLEKLSVNIASLDSTTPSPNTTRSSAYDGEHDSRESSEAEEPNLHLP